MTTVPLSPAEVEHTASHPSYSSPDRKHFGFWCLIATQFQGAFNDNALKYLVIYLIIAMDMVEQERNLLILVVGALFALPFIFFSMAGGFLADRYSKRTVTIGTKLMELCVMTFALLALALRNLPMEATAVFLLSSQAALFGPSKYGLLPELLPEKELSWGNGIIELGTFLAAITATIAAGILAVTFQGRQVWSGAVLLGFALVGLRTSFGISRVPAANEQKAFRWNPFGDLRAQLRLIGQDRVLNWAVLGNTYLWFLAALLQFTIVVYGHDVFHASEDRISYLQAAVGIGIGIGSLLAGYLSGGKIEYGLIPLGTIGMAVFSFLVARPGLGFWHAAVLLSWLGFFGGFFAVPINALIQHRPDPSKKGGVIAAANLLSFVGVFAAAGAYYLFASGLRLNPPAIFLAGAVMTLVASFAAILLLPDSLLRLILWMLTHSIYRIRVEGRDNVPGRGGALFVSNHMSFVDACLLIAATDRSIRFIMFKDIYDYPFIKPVAKMLRVIPISSQLRQRDMLRSLRDAAEAIRSGEVVCIFAEGQITRIGNLLPFRRGFERIMKGVDAPIIPVNLDGVWGSIFSFEKGRFFWKLPRRIPYPVTVSFGSPLPPIATHFEVRQAVQNLHTEAFRHHKHSMRLLHRAFIATARHFPWRFAMADARVPQLRFGTALAHTVFLARRLREFWSGQQSVGILLPPSVGGALVNFAALMLGKIPVNLNYTTSEEVLAACAKQCRLETVLTSQAFLARVPLRVPGRTLLLENIAQSPRPAEKFVSLLMAFLLPARWLERSLGHTKRPSLDDLATVIFSSGSTGDPKGVMLSHFNIGSNIEQVGQTFMLDQRDRLLGVLPFFHSFGFTVTLWLPAVLGVGVVYHPNPLDMAAISELTRNYGLTFLLATPTFLQAYMRRCAPEDFGSLQYVVVGAEKLPDRVAAAFEDRFGLRPVEGYGCTECSPVVSVNRHDFRAPGFRQVGAKRGSIGHPLPGVSVRIRNPDSGEPVPPGASGLLWVRGPNVMQGYLGRPGKTAEVLRDGWYNTGDIAKIDEDGFLIITDRLSRFSKIGGEMVPHIRVEEKLQELAGITEQTFVVTGVPDDKKGERLVVLHTVALPALKEIVEKLGDCDLPNLWVPRPNQFFQIPTLPVLGTGKLDLRRIRELAVELSQP
ncbi:MAG TPA: acyl-[ACP]--phospholipid O-acyltransferase [Candidatus Dormibacteraeota bacterium]|nr:acyl-[ACP]--phospholipid O-acyltransferase [Candidatus Dormibacteraeota bacterium]